MRWQGYGGGNGGKRGVDVKVAEVEIKVVTEEMAKVMMSVEMVTATIATTTTVFEAR